MGRFRLLCFLKNQRQTSPTANIYRQMPHSPDSLSRYDIIHGMKKIMLRTQVLTLLLLAVRCFAALPTCDWSVAERIDKSISLLRLSYDQPRLMKAHAVRIDLSDRSLAFTSNGRDKDWGRPMPDYTNGIIRTKRVTVPDFFANARAPIEEGGRGLDMLLAFNTAPWGPWVEPFTHRYGDPRGLNIADGVIVSDNALKTGTPFYGKGIFVVWTNGLADIVTDIPPARRGEVWVAHTGFCLVLKDGQVQHEPDEVVHPRTVVGLSRDRRWLYVLVLEGRHPETSLGANLHDLGQIMLSLGATDAVNMDGGGSTTLVCWDADAKRQVTRFQQGRRGPRPCALVMGVYRRAGSEVHPTPIYEARNADISPDAVRCRLAGTPVLDGDVFASRDFWTLANYDNRLDISIGGEDVSTSRPNGRAVGAPLPEGLCLNGSAKTCDTAWSATSGKILLKGTGPRYRLGFSIDTTITIKLPNSDGENWRSTIFWYGGDGKEIAKSPIAYSVPRGQRTDVAMLGDIPKGAASFSLRLGFDWPNIGPVNRVVFSNLTFEELSDSPFYAPEATFVSEVREGGSIAWCAAVPDGCAVRFQWRGASSLEELVKKPFSGPNGTDQTFFEASFQADAPFMQYRVLLCSNGKATPALYEVSGGKWTDRDWTLTGDVRPPRARRISPSPTRNSAETLRIEVKDATSTVLWDSMKVLVDGVDRTAAFTRKGDVISLEAPSGGWTPGLHTAEVCVVDFHMNKAKSAKMFYVGDAPTTPNVTLRDDGITLIDGKPFFPIGIYAVCKRAFNGESYDAAFKGLKAGGFNLAHTYANSYASDFLAAAAKYGFKLWVAARFPDRRLIDEGRHNPSIIAWYLGDDTSDHILPELEADYDEAVKAVDPTRITVQADPILHNGSLSRYADYVTATDGFMPEIYPVRNKEGDPTDRTCVAVTIRDMKQFAEDVRLHGDGKPRTCWAILQYFKGWEGWRHFPSREQLFATTFAAVIHGAHGVTWYTYGGFDKNEGVTTTPERWRNICDLATRLSELSPMLVERTPPQPPTPLVLSGPKTDPLGAPAVTCLLKRHDGWKYLLAVNAAAEPVSAVLFTEEAKTVEVLYEKRVCAAEGGRITDDFAPFAVHIYRWR